MTQCSSSSVHSSTQRPDTSEQRWQREASPSPWYRRRLFFLCGGSKMKADLSVTRKSTCPLSDGSEPLCHAGAGLPDDRRGPDAAGGRGCREAPQRRVSQPRLSAAAPDPRHEPGEGAEETPARTRTVKHTRTPNGTDVRASSRRHTHTSLLPQRSGHASGGHATAGRTEEDPLDRQKTSRACEPSLAQSIHRR